MRVRNGRALDDRWLRFDNGVWALPIHGGFFTVTLVNARFVGIIGFNIREITTAVLSFPGAPK